MNHIASDTRTASNSRQKSIFNQYIKLKTTPNGHTVEFTDRTNGDAQISVEIETRSDHHLIRLPVQETLPVTSLLQCAIEAFTSAERIHQPILLEQQPEFSNPENLFRDLILNGVLVETENGLQVNPTQFWQNPDLWLTTDAGGLAYPEHFLVTDGKRHPRRRPSQKGTLYRRFIPWLGGHLSFRVADPDVDTDRFSRWMNDPRVAEIWEDDGPMEKHRAILEERAADPHIMALICEFDGNPFGYFEVYWAKENRLGPHYDCDDYDRGWHVAIGEDGYRGRAWVSAWLPSLVHFMFLDDPRTRRIVGEPRSSHHQQIRNLDKSGFSKVKHFDFPHKQAMLVMQLRERYFGDHFWAPEVAINS